MPGDDEKKEKEKPDPDIPNQADERSALLGEIQRELDSLSPEALKRLQALLILTFGKDFGSK